MRHALTLLSLLVMGDLRAQREVVVPADAAARDAATLTDLAGFHRRFQQQIIIRGALLNGFSEISRLAVRRDGQFGVALVGGRARLDVRLSVASVSPGSAGEVFASNQGAATLVYSGEVTIPNSPALPHRDAATWSTPHAVEIVFQNTFPYVGGDLCVDLRGEPVSGAASVWWPIDCALYTHGAQVTQVGSTCDSDLVVRASRATLQPGSSMWLLATGKPSTLGLVIFGDDARLPGLPLSALGAIGCSLYVQPMVMLSTSFGVGQTRGAGDAALRVHLPALGNFLGATLGVQWLNYPSPVNPAGFTTSAGLRLQLAGTLPPFDAVQVRTGPLTATQPWPAQGEVSANRFPVLRLAGQ